MRGKKAWLRIAEAFISIVLIAGVFLVLYSKTIDKPKISESIYKLEGVILDEISSNIELRQAVLDGDKAKIESFIIARIPPGLEFSARICEPEEICGLQEYKEEVY